MDVVPRFFLYGEAEQVAEARFLHIETIASRSTRYQRRIAPHRHPALVQFFLVTSGGGTALIDRIQPGFTAPSLIFMPSSVIHGFDFRSGTEGWVLTLAEGYAAEIARETGTAAATRELLEPLVLALDAESADPARLATLFAEVATEQRWRPLGWSAGISALLRLIFIATARLAAERAVSSGTEEDPALAPDAAFYARFHSLVEIWFRDHRPLADYARALGVGEKRLNRLCRRIAGESPAALIQARLATEAERALLYGSATVAEIGYALGFRDPAYFSRFFRRRFGAAPRDYAARKPA